MNTLANQLVIAEREEVARGVKLLLASPLITERTGGGEFDLVRAPQAITMWFDYYCGWGLMVEPRRGYARLAKVRSTADDPACAPAPLRPGPLRSQTLCPAVRRRGGITRRAGTPWATCRRVTRATADDPALPRSTPRVARSGWRSSTSCGCWSPSGCCRSGRSTDSYAESAAAKVLYRVDTTLLMRLHAAPVGPSRRLSTAEEVALRFEELLGRILRERRYGRPRTRADAVHVRRPSATCGCAIPSSVGSSTIRSSTATICPMTSSRISRPPLGGSCGSGRTGRVRPGGTGRGNAVRGPRRRRHRRPVSRRRQHRQGRRAPAAGQPHRASATEQLAIAAAGLLDRFPRWAKAYRETDGCQQLVRDALAVLTGFGLVRVTGGLVLPLPAAAW